MLLVDDEPIVREVVEASLRELGFDVVCAPDGERAVEIFKQRKDDIACVILDLTMPKMGGEETFAALREVRSDVAVLLSSGFSEEALSDRIGVLGIAGFLQKPFSFVELQGALRSLLEPEGPDSR